MNVNEFAEKIVLPFEPNQQQKSVIEAISRFCFSTTAEKSIFLLLGYAGTGKTSIMSSLVKSLKALRIHVELMAPTGRAAKVFSKMSGHKASTIHRKIYKTDDSGFWSMEIAYNPIRDGIFIVDEASMIGSNESKGGDQNLLRDLLEYVYSGDGCKMILLGDTAQLPPVGYSDSPALNVATLKQYGLRVSRAILTEVARQKKKSGILYNATLLRKSMLLPELPEIRIRTSGMQDIHQIEGPELKERIEQSYNDKGLDNTIVITKSNKQAVMYNRAIREKILEREEEICEGERLMVVKNNYMWSCSVKGLDFIANGDLGVVEKIYDTESKYGFRFANVRLNFPDLNKELECKILLDILSSNEACLTEVEALELTEKAINDEELFPNNEPLPYRWKALKGNEYVNALQVKYGYAITCHKAQGGQWDDVYIDSGRNTEDLRSKEFYRWMYTGITRSVKELFLINPNYQIF